jgi:integrase
VDVIAKWIDQHPAAPKTKATYRSVLACHIEPAFGAVKLSRVSRTAVRELLLETMPKSVGHSTVITARTLLAASLSEAVRQRKIPENPASGIRLPHAGSARAEFEMASAAQLRIIEAALPEQWRIVLWLMRGCGLRIGEALAVRNDNARGDMLRVEEQVLGTGQYGPLKHRRPGEYRDVPLPDYVAEKIAESSDADPARDHYLVPLMRPWRFRAAWRTGANNAGLPKTFRPHDLRHTWTSVMLASGIPITDVSRWLGHRSIQLTHSVYGHLIPATASRAVAVLDSEYQHWAG